MATSINLFSLDFEYSDRLSSIKCILMLFWKHWFHKFMFSPLPAAAHVAAPEVWQKSCPVENPIPGQGDEGCQASHQNQYENEACWGVRHLFIQPEMDEVGQLGPRPREPYKAMKLFFGFSMCYTKFMDRCLWYTHLLIAASPSLKLIQWRETKNAFRLLFLVVWAPLWIDPNEYVFLLCG